MFRPLPDQEILRALLDYNPETGTLFFRARSAVAFRRHKDPQRAADLWNAINVGKPALNRINAHGYREGQVCGEVHRAHRIIWKLVHGHDPEIMDHINRCKDDNRLANLRTVTALENNRNKSRHATNKSGETGVFWSTRKRLWLAAVTVNYKTTVLGEFRNKAAAIEARRQAAIQHGFTPNHGTPAPQSESAAS